jgi:hypothetical protein
MSLLVACHFDAGSVPTCFTVSVATIIPSTTVSRTGSYSLRFNGNALHLYSNGYLNFPSAKSEFYFQGAFYCAFIPTVDSQILSWLASDGTVLGGIKFNAVSTKFDFYTGNYAFNVGTSTTAFSVATWHVLEFYINISDSGTLSLRVNTIPDVTISCDTKPGTQTSISQLRFSNLYYGSTSAYVYWDDLIINDTLGSVNNSWPNNAKVYYLPLTGDGATKQWDVYPSGLTHFTSISETPPSAVDYIRATTTNLLDIFSVADLPAEAGTIKAVIPEIYAFKGSTDAPTKLSIGLDVGGGVEYSADKTLTINQSLINNFWEQRPGGGNFSSADVNALQLYLKSLP